eukprot:TRINITY_DN62888_c0_g1_i1.p1 TRINITY_DN62888_c0_g1~~TRINITY_DN62888_c0_g1_i1.p1  ORF type:complete len:318 (+),score=92.34 TRINITY_DN62888_c0_g1_i1:117-956(+)
MPMMAPDESIYNIIPPRLVHEEKPPMYKSTHSGTLPPSASTFHTKQNTTYPATSNLSGLDQSKPIPDKTHATKGKPVGSYRSTPDDYMKKQAKTGPVASLAEVKKSNPELLKPTTLKPAHHSGGIPKASEAPVMNLVTSKNFIVANAVETILAAPRKVSEGAKDYLHKEDYGKVPKYLRHIKADIEREYDYIRQMEQNQSDMYANPVRPMADEERQELINGLKAKWEQVNTEYQGGTHLTKLDTTGKMKRKEKYEAQLAQIEKDIEKLSRKNIQIDEGY